MRKIPFEKSTWFNDLFLEYTSNREKLQPFYTYEPNLEGLKLAAANKEMPQNNRSVLVKSLLEQYKAVDGFEGSKVQENILKLGQPNVFTVTTGQQLHPFLGPQMVFNKIEAAISVAQEYTNSSDVEVVPVFWMASEDHDFEEIKKIQFFGKEFVWETEQKGAVGRMKMDGLLLVIDEMIEEFQRDQKVVDYLQGFREIYAKHSTYAEATRELAFSLFEKEGLIAIDGDDESLKRMFAPYLSKEIQGNYAYEELKRTTDALKELGYKTILNPMQENLFLLEDGSREKLSKSMESSFAEFPEKLSPNVVLRPLYQEVILPNIAYFAGPSELCYWLQLKGVFDAHEVNYPVVLPRKFTLAMKKKDVSAILGIGMELEKLYEPEKKVKNFVLESGSQEFIQNLEETMQKMEALLQSTSDLGAKIYKEAKLMHQQMSKQGNQLKNMLSDEPFFKDKINKMLRIKQQYFENPKERDVFGIESKVNDVEGLKGDDGYFTSLLNTNILIVEK